MIEPASRARDGAAPGRSLPATGGGAILRASGAADGDPRGERMRPWVAGALTASLLVLLGVALSAGWSVVQSGRALRGLASDHQAMAAGFDSPAARLREGVGRMERWAVRAALSEDGPARIAFDREAHELTALLARQAGPQASAEVTAALERVRVAWAHSLDQLSPMLERPVRAVRRDTAAQVFTRVDAALEPLREACEAWGRARGEVGLDFPAHARGVISEAGHAAPRDWALGVGAVVVAVGLGWGVHAGRLRRLQGLQAARAARREELVSLGTFMAGVAHEIRHPLAAIKVRLFELRRQQADAAALGTVEVMEGEVRRLERMLDEVLAYARPAELRLARTEIGGLLAGVADLVRAAYERRGVQLEVARGEPLVVEVDAEGIRQVLLNLVRNAAESLGDGVRGTVTLRAAAGVDGRGRGRVQQVVLVEVADTGPGIPEAVQARLFEPFFSTKPGGTGLGLAIAQRVVEAHGGDLRYRTQPGAGTTFTLVLPRRMHDEGTGAAGRG